MLCEAHLLPGALQKNAGLKFLCETVDLRVETDVDRAHQPGSRSATCCASRSTTSRATTCATSARSPSCGPRTGSSSATSTIPNGSLDDIAGICNAEGNVVGLMPHPERASDALLGSTDGVVLLKSLLAAATTRATMLV